jgi:hypothetical protein
MTNARASRTFRVPGLAGDEGRALFKVGGNVVYAVDVKGDKATLTSTAAEGAARVVAAFDRQETLDAIIEGRLHPVVAGLQGRYAGTEGDRRFGLSVLLALRASAPVFAQGKA